MEIIDQIETVDRGLSMGAIGYFVPGGTFGPVKQIDMSVAIRTAVIRDGVARFSVGGGITIESDPEQEYEESLTKAKAMLDAMNGTIDQAGNKETTAGV
jgi:anthranilate/para-aminobenzoate synthase component I